MKRNNPMSEDRLMQEQSSEMNVGTILRTKTRFFWDKVFSAISAFWHEESINLLLIRTSK